MSRRVVIGERANGNHGFFVAPPGVDALTAVDSALLLNISNKVSQLILLGSVPSSATIPLGLGQQPIVFITSYDTFGFIGTTRLGPLRPSPVAVGEASSHVVINSGGASMSIVSITKVAYAVYSKAF